MSDREPRHAGGVFRAPWVVAASVGALTLGVLAVVADARGALVGVKKPYIVLAVGGALFIALIVVLLRSRTAPAATPIQRKGTVVCLLTFTTAACIVAAVYLFWREQHFDLDGTDPQKTGCVVGSFTVQQLAIRNSSGATIATAYLKYSPRCETNWVRADNIVKEATVRKTIWRKNIRHWVPFPFPSRYKQVDDDTVTGSSYGMQIWAPGTTCVEARVDITDRHGTLLGGTGAWSVCG